MEASNAQMMREAFDEILCRIDAWRTDGTMEHWQYSQLFDIADAALALPLRNCDVGTAEEQVERFKAYCESNMQYFRDMFGTHEGAGGWDCREDCPVGKMIDKNDSLSDHCELVWAQMPYEKEDDDGK